MKKSAGIHPKPCSNPFAQWTATTLIFLLGGAVAGYCQEVKTRPVESTTQLSNAADPDFKYVVAYRLDKLIDQLIDQEKLDRKQAKLELTNRVSARLGIDLSKETSPETIKSFQWDSKANVLVFHHTRAMHDRVRQTLEQFQAHGFGSSLVELRFLICDAKLKKWITAKTKKKQVLYRADKETKAEKPRKSLVRQVSFAVMEKELPVSTGQLDDEDVREVFAALKTNTKSKIMMAPKMIAFNGQPMSCFVGSERPFVAGLKNDMPFVMLCQEGVATSVTMVPRGADEVGISLSLELKKIAEVSDFEIKDKRNRKIAIQIPHLENTKVNVHTVVKYGKTVVIDSPMGKDKEKGTSVIVLVTPRKVEKPAK